MDDQASRDPLPPAPPAGGDPGRAGTGGPAPGDPSRLAETDLLGVLAYGQLVAFSRLGADAELAPTLTAKAGMARLAVAEFGHYERLAGRLVAIGADPERAMEPFVAPLDAFHERTAPGTWLEGLVKAYVGEGISADFYREISRHVDPVTRDLVTSVVGDTARPGFLVAEVRRATEADPRTRGRLALWGRRLVGEALSQAQRVATDRDALASLTVGGAGRAGADLAELMRMFSRLTAAHTRRMAALGLDA